MYVTHEKVTNEVAIHSEVNQSGHPSMTRVYFFQDKLAKRNIYFLYTALFQKLI